MLSNNGNVPVRGGVNMMRSIWSCPLPVFQYKVLYDGVDCSDKEILYDGAYNAF